MLKVSIRHLVCILFVVSFVFHYLIKPAEATIACYQCHGSTTPSDYRPIDNTYRNITTGGFAGNHRTHMDSTATSRSCAKCHPGSGEYKTSHRDGYIKLSGHMNNSPLATLYRNASSAFPQSAAPNLQFCSNVNCHFEKNTPAWGSTPLVKPGGCNICHGVPPANGDSGAAGSHGKHDIYYTGAANCGKCHSDHLSEPTPFAHATSVAKRPLPLILHDPSGVTGGSYSGPLDDYLPKSSTNIFGSCSSLYCHSNGCSVATGQIVPNTTPAWGSAGPLACNSCHGNPPDYANGSPKANSHPIHATHSITDCSICHYGTTTTGNTITDITKHVNKNYDLQAKPGYGFNYTFNSAGGNCASNTCHSDAQWGTGSPGGALCICCHGHSAGFEYESGKFSQGRGSWRSHATHTQNDGGNAKGPNVACGECHDTTMFPFFKSGTDANSDGKFSLSETDVCNTCHSPGGAYDGVNDAIIGAKANWRQGVYSSSILRPGKEKWCAGCHDDSPSVIASVSAPNVIGFESASYNYGSGWGYYKTGHGVGSGSTYPASGGATAGAGSLCSDCHSYSTTHIDGTARTYVYTATIGASNDYQNGYRLKSINGNRPMAIPRNNGCSSGVNPDDFRLCMSCHNNAAFINSGNQNTNFRNISTSINDHYYHLEVKYSCGPGPKFASDWRSHSYDSQVSCVTCHNVHGSSQLAMVRDGHLINKSSGLEVAYYNPTVSYVCGGPSPYPPTPGNVTLPNSTGTVWNANVGNVCGGCHGSCGFNVRYPRTPFDNTPPRIKTTYGKVGGNVLALSFSEVVYSDQGAVGALVPSDFALTDADNGRTITNVNHTAGSTYAKLTLSTPVDASNDIGVDTVAAAGTSSIYDSHNLAMGTTPVSITNDSTGPILSGQIPAASASSIAITSNITFTLTDTESGVDWSGFSIQLSGNKGYSKTYTPSDTAIVSKSGTPAAYSVTVDPDANFGFSELITVTVTTRDMVGNQTTPSWSFTTAASSTPENIIRHPSGVVNAGEFTTFGGDWDTVLDSSDGLTSRVLKCGGSGYPSNPASRFIVDMDNSGLSGGTIQGIELGISAKYAPSCPTSGTTTGLIDICYKTGTNTVCTERTVSGDFSTYTASFTNDSDGGSLDIADIDNLQIEIRRKNTGSINLIVSEVYVNVTYLP